MYLGAEEQRQIEQVKRLLEQAGITVDEERYIIRKGREYVYFSSLMNMKRLFFLLHDALEAQKQQQQA